MDGLMGRNVRDRMVEFIKSHYSGILGEDLKYLDMPGGLEVLHKKYCRTA